MSFRRLTSDFRFGLLMAFGALTVLGLVPMAAYRFYRGQPLVGMLDSVVVVALVLTMTYLWRGGSVDRTAQVGCAIVCVGSVSASLVLGLPGMLWFYPVILYNFLMIPPIWAAVVSGLSLACIAAFAPMPAPFMRMVFVLTTMIVGLFAFVFARRSSGQNAQLKLLVTRDALTESFNRRALEQELPIVVDAARAGGASHVSLAVLDLDHFKTINDSFGHEAGDRVLMDFAALVTRSTRRADRLFRYGGEEFVLLLPGADHASLHRLADDLRARVANELSVEGRPVTVSIGAAQLAPGESAREWLARADGAMYEAKRSGRNRVVVAPLPDAGGGLATP